MLGPEVGSTVTKPVLQRPFWKPQSALVQSLCQQNWEVDETGMGAARALWQPHQSSPEVFTAQSQPAGSKTHGASGVWPAPLDQPSLRVSHRLPRASCLHLIAERPWLRKGRAWPKVTQLVRVAAGV